jgi:hypothetical protein
LSSRAEPATNPLDDRRSCTRFRRCMRSRVNTTSRRLVVGRRGLRELLFRYFNSLHSLRSYVAR